MEDAVPAETAVNPLGQAALFVAPLPSPPAGARASGRGIAVSCGGTRTRYLVDRASSAAARRTGALLVVEVAAGRGVVRETWVPVR